METTIIDDLFKNKKFNPDKALEFGFKKDGNNYSYQTNIVDDQFQLLVKTNAKDTPTTKLTDISNGIEYRLHLDPKATGKFVSVVKNEFLTTITDISKSCYDSDVFKTKQSKLVSDYGKSNYGSKLEFLWKKFPTNAIMRRTDNNKWYALLIGVNAQKVGLDLDQDIEILDVRIDTDDIDKIVDSKNYFHAYHMNKQHWITIYLDGTVPDKEILERIDESYELATK